jgi:DAACS family dicarboxylate/amino acid:cation (Na+ or H+) symporter
MKRHYLLLAALVLGVVLGAALHPFADNSVLQALSQHLLNPAGQIFLRLIFMVVVPLVFSALVLGVYELGQSHGLGAVAGKTLVYTLIASTASVVIGITLVNLFQPGRGYSIDPAMLSDQAANVANIQKNASQASNASQALVDLIPKNPLDSATKALAGEMLPLMVFALIFGIALSMVARKGKSFDTLTSLLEQIFAVSMKVIDFAMVIAPIGVFAIVFNTIFKFGAGVLGSILGYVLVVVLGLAIQQFVVYAGLLKGIARRSPWKFFHESRDVYLYAFSTASSNATLPLAIETAEHKLKLPPKIARFVLTVGSTANQNGTALFEGITVLFLAQVYGIDLSVGQQAQVVFMSILAGVGTAGVPGGSLPMIMILLQSVGIPPEGIGLILGSDRFLDMCRTTLNVSGDLVISALVSGKQKA